jgi:hypothetical protein
VPKFTSEPRPYEVQLRYAQHHAVFRTHFFPSDATAVQGRAEYSALVEKQLGEGREDDATLEQQELQELTSIGHHLRYLGTISKYRYNTRAA